MKTKQNLVALIALGVMALAYLPGEMPSAAEKREIVLSLRNLGCGSCWPPIEKALKNVSGVESVSFDQTKVEVNVALTQDVSDSALLSALLLACKSVGFAALIGPGKGSYEPPEEFPDSADVYYLSKSGEEFGDLKNGLAPGKVTIVDFYAVWCGPCRVVDKHLIKLLGLRDDIAVRKVNVVDFKSPVAKKYLKRVKGLPYVEVYGKNGKRIAKITGLDIEKLDKAIEKAGKS